MKDVCKVVCIFNDKDRLTIGKLYTVHAITDYPDGSYYYIFDDRGISRLSNVKHFKLLSEMRDDKINQILK